MNTAGGQPSANEPNESNEPPYLNIRLTDQQLQQLAVYIVLVIEAKYPPPQNWAEQRCPNQPTSIRPESG